MELTRVSSHALLVRWPGASSGRPVVLMAHLGMTNATKTVGGALASAVFAITLASTGSLDGPEEGQAPLSGHLTVRSICAVAALLAALALLAMPKDATERPVRVGGVTAGGPRGSGGSRRR